MRKNAYKGTTFTLTLPKRMSDSAKKKILIVEDDADIREGLIELLENEGYAVDEAENGKVALSKLSNGMPFAILLDLMMPVMDGFAFLMEFEKLKAAASQDVPVLVLTAAGDRASQVKGIRAVIRKPVDIDQLLEELNKL